MATCRPDDWEVEITLQPSPKPEAKKRTAGISYAERSLRISCHKVHTVALLTNARIRNQWLNDPLLHARLLSLTPMHLQNAFAMIHKSRVPDQNQRGRMFEAAIRNLTEWWTSSFFDVLPQGHIRSRTYDDVQARLAAHGLPPSPDKLTASTSSTPLDEASVWIAFLTSDFTLLDAETLQDLLDDEGETIRGPKSLMKHALMRCGSRDTSAQLFTALCRSLGIPARLAASLQSVPWQSSVGKPKPTYQRKGKGKAKQDEQEERDDEEDDDMEEVDIPTTPLLSAKGLGKERARSELVPFSGDGQRLDGEPVQHKSEKAKGKEKAKPPINLRKQRPKGNRLGSRATSTESSRVEESPDPLSTPPVFWTEVFSRPDGRWIPVDPIRCIVNKRKAFDPTLPGNSALVRPTATARQENRMMYVLGFEEDGYARDVTRRYAREYSAKVVKAQAGGGGRGRQLWWDAIVQTVTRPYRLQRDDVEDEELDVAQLMEGMPTTLAGFKDHPLYVLERHLKQNEVIHPPPPETSELGKFRGESVYPRGAVIPLKTAETWLRTEGRTIGTGSQPLKMTKLRASTVGKMREVEVLREAGAGDDANAAAKEVMQGLYARSQTEIFVPDPVINGIVPKNNFGNIDLYVPSMLPEGAAHVPFKGAARIARKLEFDHAEAVTGFEFKKRRAFPVLEGVVIAKENEQALLEAYWESERVAEEKARAKREDQAIKRWIRLIQGLRIRQRLQDQYANKPDEGQDGQEKLMPEAEATTSGGGFLLEADDVVQAFSLPKYQHVPVPSEPTVMFNHDQKHITTSDTQHEDLDHAMPEYVTYDIQAMDFDPAEDDASSDVPLSAIAVPITMQQLAEAAAKKQNTQHGGNGVKPIPSTPTANNNLDNQTLRSQKFSCQSTPPRGVKTRRRTAPATKGRGSAKSRTAVGRNHSSRKRGRPSEQSDTHIDSDESSLEGEFGSEHDDNDDDPPKKRSRTLAGTSSKRASSPPTRILRPRKSKIGAQLEAE